MKNKIVLTGLICVQLILAGCATITRGTTEALVINSQPPGAEVQISNGMRCKTPCTVEVKRKKDLVLNFDKSGYEPLQTTVVSEIAGAGAAGMAGNVILGGLIGAGVDAASGATKKLTPNPVSVVLTQAQIAVAVPVAAPAVVSEAVTLNPAIEQMCDQSSKVDRMQCRGELNMGMKQDRVEQLLGAPDARSSSGRGLRYADRVLTFDESGGLIDIHQASATQ